MGKLDALLVWMQTSGQHLLNIGKNATQKKTSQLTSARGIVTKLSKYGHGGKATTEAKLVCVSLNLIFLPLKMCINC
jgi:hypothetical protein